MNHRNAFTLGMLPALIAVVLFPVLAVAEAETSDVTIYAGYDCDRRKTAEFYYNGRAVGAGREVFARIIEWVDALPAGTSVVWGPNYKRCGACSGSEPHCLPKHLFPDLWVKLQAAVERRRLSLSSAYPGPWPHASPADKAAAMPLPLDADDPAATGRFAAILDWRIAAHDPDRDRARRLDETRGFHRRGAVWHRCSSAGTMLRGYDLDLFLGRLPEKARVLVRVAFDDSLSPAKRDEYLAAIARDVHTLWPHDLGSSLRLGKLQATLTAPPKLAEELRRVAMQLPLEIDWSNFHGPETRHEEVLYLLDGQFIGRGESGFDHLLAGLGRLPEGAEGVLPGYELSGRWAMENFSDEQRAAENAKLANLAPYAARRAELDALISKRKLSVTRSIAGPTTEEPRTVMDWGGGDRFAEAFVSFGRIVYHDEQRRPAPHRLAWSRYDAAHAAVPTWEETRQVENEAFYTWNDTELGQGVNGFAQAMEKMAKLPAASVVDVRVCLRTKPPFRCPLIYQGHRHFERTGFEPYVGMFPWLLDVARRHQLEVRWIPDELATCSDCQLNR